MIVFSLITGLLASQLANAKVVFSHGRHSHAAHNHNVEFRHLQEANATSYSVEVSGISLMDVDTKIPGVSSDMIRSSNVSGNYFIFYLTC